MRLLSVLALVVFSASSVGAAAPPRAPECHYHKLTNVSFRNATAKDVMEISVGMGPCTQATLTLIIRSEEGHVLYNYASPVEQHLIVDWASPNAAQEAQQGLAGFEARIESTTALAPYMPPEKFEEEHSETMLVPRATYEALRKNGRPMLSHQTYHEGWQSVIFDETKNEAVIVVSGGV